MKKLVIALGIILGVGLLLIGIGIIILAANPDKFGKLSGEEFEEKHLVEEQTVNSFVLEVGSDLVEILPSEDGKLSITYYESNRRYFEYSYRDGKAVFKQKNKGWSIFWGINNNNRPTMKIYLPDTVNDTLDIDMSSGSLKTDIDKLTLKKLQVEVSSGLVDLSNIEADSCKIDVSSGSVKISDIVAADFDIDISSGLVNFDNCTANTMRIGVSSGTLKIEELTANNLKASLSSGSMKISIKGSLDDYRVKGKASSGKVVVNRGGEKVSSGDDVSCGSGDKLVSVSVSSGSASIDFEE